MEAVERASLEAAVKELTLNGLNALIAHNVKGAELIKKGVEAMMTTAEGFQEHWEQLKAILQMLKPVFELVRDWLVSCYNHLVELFDWARAKWHEIFG